MTEWSENSVKNVNEDDNLAAMNKNNHEQEYCDNNLNQSMNPPDHISHDSQKCWKEKGKFSTILPQSLLIKDIDRLKCISQVMNVKNVKLNYKGMKIQYLQVEHQKVLYHLLKSNQHGNFIFQ